MASNDIASGSEVMPCNKIDKSLVVYSVSGNVMTSIIHNNVGHMRSITTLRT